jgi:hypothetical protein
MNQHSVVTAGLTAPVARRAGAGAMRLSGRDVGGLLLCGDMYGAPYDLLASAGHVPDAEVSWPDLPGTVYSGECYAHAREIEARAHHDPTSPAVTALRTRILDRFSELETERATIGNQLDTLAKQASHQPNPGLLDALPLAADLLPDAPPRILQRLCQAFDLQLLCSKEHHQVTIWATITPSIPPP